MPDTVSCLWGSHPEHEWKTSPFRMRFWDEVLGTLLHSQKFDDERFNSDVERWNIWVTMAESRNIARGRVLGEAEGTGQTKNQDHQTTTITGIEQLVFLHGKVDTVLMEVWHVRMGHLNQETLRKL